MRTRPAGPATAGRPALRVAGRIAAPLLVAALAGCATTNPHFDPAKAHHRPDGFNNRFHDNFAPGQPSFWRWQWERWQRPPPPSRPGRVPVAEPDRAALTAPTLDASVTWLGHAGALWRVAGLNILVDPHLGERASPVSFAGPRRETRLPVGLGDLPRIDLVLITHNHYDHLDRGTVRALADQAGGEPLFVVPLGVDRWMTGEGIRRVQRMDWWDVHRVAAPGGPVDVHFVPAQHWSSRTPWDRNATLWGGFVVQASVAGRPLSMYASGDTGWSPDFAEIGERFGGFDYAQIPVGCYLPRWFMSAQHVDEAEAVRIHQAVRSRFSVGVHWGAFRLCDDPIDAPLDGLPPARAAAGVASDAFVLMAIGETRVLRRASTAAP